MQHCHVNCAVTSLQPSSDDTGGQANQVNGLSFSNRNSAPSPFIPSSNIASLSQRNDFYDPSQQPTRFNSYSPYQQLSQPQYNQPPMYPFSNSQTGYGNAYNTGAQAFYPNYRQPNPYVPPASGFNPYENGQGVPSSGYQHGYQQVPRRQFGTPTYFSPSENRLSPLYSTLSDPKPDELTKKSPQ